MRGIIPLAGRKFQLISAVRIAIIATRWEIDLSTCIFSIYIYIYLSPVSPLYVENREQPC